MSISPRNPDASAVRGRVRLGRVAHVGADTLGNSAASPILLEEALEAYLDLRLLPVSQDGETGPNSVRDYVPDSLPESDQDSVRLELVERQFGKRSLQGVSTSLDTNGVGRLDTNGVGELETNGGGAGRPVRFNLKGEIL